MKLSRRPGDPAPLPALSRRQAFGALAGLAGLGAGLAGISTPARASATYPSRSLTFHNTHTFESLSVDYCAHGDYVPSALVAINHTLRDHRTGDVHAMDPALLDLLHEVAMRAGRAPEFEVISGYRSPATNARLHERSGGVASHSLHMEGRAIDIRLVGYDVARTRDVGLALARGGVGYYRSSAFVHLDTGRLRAWSG